LTDPDLLPYNHHPLVNDRHALSSSSLRIACAQLGPAIGQVAANRERATEAIDSAAAQGARLVVLPELCITGYCFADADEARGCAEPLDGPTVRGWCEQAARHDLVVVGGICELDPDGALRNSAVIVDASGVRAAYRKSHLWDREPAIFRRGDEPAPVVDTAAGRIGVAVCYDAVFPEHLRRLGLAGAEIVAVPMASPAPAQPTEPIAIEIALAMAAANSNRVYVAQADRTRDERGTRWAQASVIVDPDGSVVAGPADGEALLLADADLARARDKSWGERNDVLGDRRPELYTTTDHDPGDRLQ
jgi:predicted amidohydrolase